MILFVAFFCTLFLVVSLISVKMYSTDLWFAFLCECVVRQVHQTSLLRCPGCASGLKSAVLHLHEQQNLLEKMRDLYQEVRGTILPTLPQLYEQFQEHLSNSGDDKKDLQCYVDAGRQFLLLMTSDSIYYGRYLDEFVDGIIHGAFQIKKKKCVAGGRKRAKLDVKV